MVRSMYCMPHVTEKPLFAPRGPVGTKTERPHFFLPKNATAPPLTALGCRKRFTAWRNAWAGRRSAAGFIETGRAQKIA